MRRRTIQRGFLLKRIVALILLIALCAYATWSKMQILSIISMLLVLCLLYTAQFKEFLEIILSFARQARTAKFKDFEISTDDEFKNAIEESIGKSNPWVKVALIDLSAKHFTLLLAIYKAGEFEAKGDFKQSLRTLRDRGLVQHNKDTMYDSTIVWLTPLGTELVELILQNPIAKENNTAPISELNDNSEI